MTPCAPSDGSDDRPHSQHRAHSAPAIPPASRSREVLAVVATSLVATVLFACYGVGGQLSRDEAVYVYAGQRIVDGVPLYQGIFDPKGPLGGVLLAAVAALPGDDVLAARAAFGALSVGSVLALVLLARRLTGSLAAAVVAGLVLACARGFARDALSGPDVKTLGVLLVVVTLLATVERRWVVASLTGCAGALTWQPLAVLPLLVLVLAGTSPPAERIAASVRVLAAGCAAVLPFLVLTLATGSLDDLVEAAVVFPVTGMQHADDSLVVRLETIGRVVVGDRYGVSGPIVLAGLVLLAVGCAVGVARRTHDRVALMVPLSATAAVAMTLADFQGYPDLYPLIPFGALGWAWAVAQVRWPSAAALVVGAVTAALVVASAVTFARDHDRFSLDRQRRTAHWAASLVGPGETLWALGDPTPLVLTGRSVPDPYVLLVGGVATWKLDRLPGGVPAWRDQLLDARTTVVVVNGVTQGPTIELVGLLRDEGFERCPAGMWDVWSSVGCGRGAPR